MTISVKHTFASPKSDGTDSTLVQPSNWNAEHTFTAAAGKVIGRDASGAGVIQELPLAFDATGQSMIPPSGDTASRPATPAAGMLRYNTTTAKMELYANSAWGAVGGGATVSGSAPSSPSTGDLWYNSTTGALQVYNGSAWVTFSGNITVDAFNGNGSTTAFTLSGSAGSINNTDVYISGVYQAKSTYTLSGTTLTFSTAPPTGTLNIQVEWGAALAIGTPSDGTVTAAKVAEGSGSLRSVPQNAKTATYTLLATDNGKHISITTGGVTVPPGVFAAGDTVSIFNNSGASQTITQGSTVTLRQVGTANTGNRTLAQYGLCTVLCVSSNTFVITGGGLT